MQRSSRDRGELGRQLGTWLAERVGAAVVVSAVEDTDANGMSSDTVLFDAEWPEPESGRRCRRRLVARIAPAPDDVPVFPAYDLDRQFRIMQVVAERTAVPVPAVWWSEPAPDRLGAPFFVMSAVEGRVPPDVLPYTFGDNWLSSATVAQQQQLQQATVEVLAGLHVLGPADAPFLEFAEPGDTLLRRHVAHTRAWYDFVAADGGRSPLIDQAFAWLEGHWPASETDATVCWGDARIGNILYDGFRPAAVLDWEMAAVGPPELDVAWLVTAHRTFQDLAAGLGLAGLPDFLRLDDVVAAYQSLAGRELRDLEFYCAYATVQWGIVFLRTGQRQVHFGERDRPEAVDDLLYNRPALAALAAG